MKNFYRDGDGIDSRKRFSASGFYATIAAAILLSAFALPGLVPVQEATSYDADCREGGALPVVITYKTDANFPILYRDEVRAAAQTWNDVGTRFRLDEITSGTADINVHTANIPGQPSGWMDSIGCTNGIFPGPRHIYLNEAVIPHTDQSNMNREKVTNTAAHEFGHAIGLDHVTGLDRLMGTGNVPFPTLDDIRGVNASNMYGPALATPICSEATVNGDVTYGSSCVTHTGFPVNIKVLTAGTLNHAGAYTSPTSSELPTWPSKFAVFMTAKVKAFTLNKFSMGIYTNNDIPDESNRLMTVEINNDGYWLKWTKADGTLDEKRMSDKNGNFQTPVTNQWYYVYLYIRNGEPSYAAVYKDDTAATNVAAAFNYLNSPDPVQVEKSWSSPVFYGAGVWMEDSAEAKPNYQVKEFYNRLRLHT